MLNQYQYDKSVRSKMFAKLMGSTPVHFRYPRQGKQELSASITPGTPFEFRLSGIHGLVTELTLQVEIFGITTEIDSFDLLDESGQTMLGTRLKTRFLLASQRPKHDAFIQSGKSGKYVKVPISDSNTEAHSGAGQLNAYIVSNGNNMLSFTYVHPNGTTDAVTAAIKVFYSSVSTLEVRSGVCSIQHS